MGLSAWKSLLSSSKQKKQRNATEYVLKRDYVGSSRLNLQFFLWKDLLRYNLHPDIAKTLKPDARIADVATGTGIWMVDLARDLPSTVTFHGFDINLAQCPVADKLPANVKISQWDMFKPPPEELVGTFDVVHLRLVTLVIKDNDPSTLLENVAKLLKPGGYLQWDEIDTEGLHIESPDSVTSDATGKLFRATKIPKEVRGKDDWKWNLGFTLGNQGFPESNLHQYKYEGAQARFWHDMYMTAWEEFITKVMGGIDQNRELINSSVEETQKGVHVVYPKLVWVAKKSEY